MENDVALRFPSRYWWINSSHLTIVVSRLVRSVLNWLDAHGLRELYRRQQRCGCMSEGKVVTDCRVQLEEGEEEETQVSG